LPWDELAETGPITLYIGRTLQKEVDDLKGDGNQRRARRARDANGFFKQLRQAPNRIMVLRGENPRVEVTFLPRLDPQRPKSPLLDLSEPDDRHIEEALAFRAANPEQRTAILTHDFGLLGTADEVDLDSIEIPDSWLLEPEKDDRQKQIEDLTRQVKLLQKQYPQMSLSVFDQGGRAIEALSLSIVEYDPPSDAQVQSLLAELRSHNPRQEDFGEPPIEQRWAIFSMSGYPRKYQPPSLETIERYQQDYEKWLEKIEEFLRAFPDRLTGSTQVATITVRLENIGTEPAKSVLIDFSTTPGFLLRCPVEPDKAPQTDLQLPRRPEPPQGQYIDVLSPWADGIVSQVVV
jgi:hypothetical protein